MADDSGDENAASRLSCDLSIHDPGTQATHAKDPSVSASIQDYALQAFLGEGSTAHVYLATHVLSGDTVAIKVIDKLLIRQAQMEHKVQREILIHSPLGYRYIVAVKNAFEDTRNHYLVLEYCERGSIASLMRAIRERGGTLDEATAKSIFRQTALGVSYLHAHGIIHRDLKLSNLLLTRDGDVKISDFGLATFASDEHATVCGTPNFIAPEVLTATTDASSSYDETVDIWSLGCILYTLLLGTPPFEGAKVSDTLANVSNAGRQPLQFPRGFSATCGDLIQRMLNVDATSRPTIAQVLAHQWLKVPSPTKSTASKRIDPHEPAASRPRLSVYESVPSSRYSGARAKSKPRSTATTTTSSRQRRSRGDKNQRRPLSASYRRPVEYETDESSNGNSDAASYSSLDLHDFNLSSSSSEIDGDDDGISIGLQREPLEPLRDKANEDPPSSDASAETMSRKAIPSLSPISAMEKTTGTDPPPPSPSRYSRGRGDFPSAPAAGPASDVLFLSLRVEVTDLPLLDVAADATREIVWDCWETSDIRQLTRFTLRCNGWALVYTPSKALIQGTSRRGAAITYQCHASTTLHRASSTKMPVPDDDLMRLVRLCHCLASRSLQLRRAAMAIDVDKLPIVHYDTLPERVLHALRSESVRAAVTRQLTSVPSATSLASASPSALRCTIPGIGVGEFDSDGRLTIQFFGGATLEMNASGSTIRYRRSASESPDDVFDLAAAPFLPTEVKRHFEHVPAFVRQLKST